MNSSCHGTLATGSVTLWGNNIGSVPRYGDAGRLLSRRLIRAECDSKRSASHRFGATGRNALAKSGRTSCARRTRRAAALSDTGGTPTCTHRIFTRVFRAKSMARPACFRRQGSSTARERYIGRRPAARFIGACLLRQRRQAERVDSFLPRFGSGQDQAPR